MAKRSTIALDPRIKAAADEKIRAGATIDEILAAIQAIGGDVSRSAVGRYAKRARASMETFAEAQEVRKIWVQEFGKDPEGDLGELLTQLLSSVAYSQLQMMGNETPDLSGKEGVGPKHVALLAEAVKNITSAQKINAERIAKIKLDSATKAADVAVKIAKSGGMQADMIAQLRAAVIGTAA